MQEVDQNISTGARRSCLYSSYSSCYACHFYDSHSAPEYNSERNPDYKKAQLFEK